jgi:hypothetical protein
MSDVLFHWCSTTQIWQLEIFALFQMIPLYRGRKTRFESTTDNVENYSAYWLDLFFYVCCACSQVYGASLSALNLVATEFGYSLVHGYAQLK